MTLQRRRFAASEARCPRADCPVTVDLPFCQWILLVRRVLPLKFARFGIILRVMSVAEAAERVEPTRTRSYLPRRLHKPPL